MKQLLKCILSWCPTVLVLGILLVVPSAYFVHEILAPTPITAAPQETERERARNQAKTTEQEVATNSIIRNILYIKDPRTDICFAAIRQYYPSVTTVPCEKIPPELLVTANPYLIKK